MKPHQARAARAILKLGVREVAEGAGVAANTVARLENPDTTPSLRSTMAAVRDFYMRRGITFEGSGTFFDEDVGRVFKGLKNDG